MSSLAFLLGPGGTIGRRRGEKGSETPSNSIRRAGITVEKEGDSP